MDLKVVLLAKLVSVSEKQLRVDDDLFWHSTKDKAQDGLAFLLS